MYIMKANLLLSVFTMLFVFLFRKETWFQLNRFYLLFGIVAALLIPVLKMSLQTFQPVQFQVNDIKIPLFPDDLYYPLTMDETVRQPKINTLIPMVKLVYFGGIGLFGLRLLLFFGKLFTLINRGVLRRNGATLFVETCQHVQPFSFFNFIFYHQTKALEKDFKTIVDHELVHIRQLHTIDLLITEILVGLFWFNPFVFLLQNTVRANHEFLADAAVVNRGTDKLEYLKILAVQATSNQFGSFGSHFKSSTLKNRFVMITKKRSTIIKSYKYLLLLPLLGILISAFSLKKNPVNSIIDSRTFDLNLVSEIAGTEKPVFIQPVGKEDITRIASGWGYRIHPIYKVKKFHYGQDYALPFGSSIRAVAAGEVIKIVNHGVNYKGTGYGNYIEIAHANGFSSRYAQMSEIAVKVGDEIKQGDVIGESGNSGASTAPHLHFELHKDGKAVIPAEYLQK